MHGAHSGHDVLVAMLHLHGIARHPICSGEATIESFSCCLIPPCWTWAELLLGLFFILRLWRGICLSRRQSGAGFAQECGVVWSGGGDGTVKDGA